MKGEVILVAVFAILVVENMWSIIFVGIPLLQKRNKIAYWIGVGISLAAITMCSAQLGKLLYVLSVE